MTHQPGGPSAATKAEREASRQQRMAMVLTEVIKRLWPLKRTLKAPSFRCNVFCWFKGKVGC